MTEPFTNDVVGSEDLPRLADDRFEPLDRAFLRLRVVVAAVTTAAAGAFVAAFVVAGRGWQAVVTAAALAIAVLAVGAARVIGARHMGYLVREHDLSFRSGVVGRSVATVPFARVQHVAIRRGPIDRAFGLASLQLRTAGGFVAIPGLHVDLAGRLKQLVADRAGQLADAESDAHRGARSATASESGVVPAAATDSDPDQALGRDDT